MDRNELKELADRFLEEAEDTHDAAGRQGDRALVSIAASLARIADHLDRKTWTETWYEGFPDGTETR